MKKQILYLFIGILSLLTQVLFAQFTKQQATNLVLNQILVNELDHLDVYMSNTTISNQSVITLMNNTTVNPVYSNNWICFVDDLPFAGWAHTCRYIIIDAATGTYQIQNRKFFPTDWDTNYSSISMMSPV